MYTPRKLLLTNTHNYAQVESFLSRFNLTINQIDTCFAIYNQQDQIIATASRYHNVLKCFAIDPDYQSLGLMGKLMSVLLEECFYLHIKDLFVFTKKENESIFHDYQFKTIYADRTIALLHHGIHSIQYILSQYKQFKNKKIGSIVMNANPFTLGHLHLVETACRSVEQLYVFVLEEEASMFSFDVRYKLVKAGVAHLKNVEVVPSSQFMISTATFPTYFLKDQQVVVKTQAQMDVHIFGMYFVPHLNIQYRFIGEEPYDVTTRMYNQTLKAVLPSYGVKVIEIPRLQNVDKPISASFVRHLIDTKALSKIKEMVPKTTYDYIKSTYF